jgi:hypothetical protein
MMRMHEPCVGSVLRKGELGASVLTDGDVRSGSVFVIFCSEMVRVVAAWTDICDANDVCFRDVMGDVFV